MYVVDHHHPVDDEEKFFVQVLVLVDSLLRREKLKSQEKPGEALSVILVRKSFKHYFVDYLWQKLHRQLGHQGPDLLNDEVSDGLHRQVHPRLQLPQMSHVFEEHVTSESEFR